MRGVKVAVTPPWRMNVPSCTLRTRNTAGLNVTVNVTIDSRDAFATLSGTVYGPPAVRNSCGAVIVTCAAGTGGTPAAPLGATLGSRGGTPAGGTAPGGGAIGVTVGAGGTVPGAAPGGSAPTGAIGGAGGTVGGTLAPVGAPAGGAAVAGTGVPDGGGRNCGVGVVIAVGCAGATPAAAAGSSAGGA